MTKAERELKLQEKLEELKNYDLKENKRVLGIDEAGRGPLAGPVVVAGVIMKNDSKLLGVRDSKKISEKLREELYDKIIEEAEGYYIAFRDNEQIDEVNILQATKDATAEIIYNLKDKTDIVFLDALNGIDTFGIESRSIIKGDDTSYAISCASILAKVTRDRIMKEYDKIYPEYDFAKHKGYGTKAHYEAIFENGISKIHRKSFLKNLENHKKK